MKKTVFLKFVVMAAMIGAVVTFQSCATASMTGNGNLISFERSFEPFESISSMATADVRYYASDEHRVVVTVNENLKEHVDIFSSKNILHIGIKKNSNGSFTKFLVEVYSPTLKSVVLIGSDNFEGNIEEREFSASIIGSGDIIVTGASEELKVNIAGSGDFKGNGFYTKNTSVNIAGSGDVSITGASEELKVNIAGSGDFKGNQFKTNNTSVNITGSGDAAVNVENKLNVNITGSGKVRYRGETTDVITLVTSSGKVKKVN